MAPCDYLNMPSLAARILKDVQHHWPHALILQRTEPLHGGSINRSMVLHCQGISFFAKTNAPRYAPVFTAERHALAALEDTGTVCVPRPICQGGDNSHAWLVLEYLPMSSAGDAFAAGQHLAAMHQHTADYFGFHEDNYIGLTPQYNTPADNWLAFFRDQRLRPQMRWLKEKGMVDADLARGFDAVLDHLDIWLGSHQPVPSLLHGDLWSGNYGFHRGQLTLFDPACYYGDRETDLAMTRLFGGFPVAFYRGYEDRWPLPAGASERTTLYNLYHILNHANLFGHSYLQQAAHMVSQLEKSLAS